MFEADNTAMSRFCGSCIGRLSVRCFIGLGTTGSSMLAFFLFTLITTFPLLTTCYKREGGKGEGDNSGIPPEILYKTKFKVFEWIKVILFFIILAMCPTPNTLRYAQTGNNIRCGGRRTQRKRHS